MKRILLVEDDEDIAKDFEESLRAKGYDVVKADCEKGVREKVESGKFEIILSDTNLGFGQWG